MIELGHVTDRKAPFRYAAFARVGFSDTDAQGVVYYGRYMPYFDLARTEYHRHLGRVHLGEVDFAMRAVTVEYVRRRRVRRPARGLRPRRADRDARASPTTTPRTARRRQADGDREGDARLHRARRAQGRARAGDVPRPDPDVPAAERSAHATRVDLAELFGGGHVVHLATLRPTAHRRAARSGRSCRGSRRLLHAGLEPQGARISRDPRVALSVTDRRTPTGAPGCAAASRARRGRRRARDHRPHLARLHRPAVPDAERHRLRRRRRGAGLGDLPFEDNQ